MYVELEPYGYELITEIGEWNYSWSITNIYKKDGRFFALSDSGCSCTDFGSDWGDDPHTWIGEMEEVTSLAAAMKYCGSQYTSVMSVNRDELVAAGLR